MQTVFIKPKWESNLIVPIASVLYDIVACFSISTWIYYIYERNSDKRIPQWFVDLWVFIILFVEVAFLFFFQDSWLVPFIGMYGIIDVMVPTLRDTILAPQIERGSASSNGSIIIRNSVRWFLLTSLNIIQIIFAFAILINHYGNEYYPAIKDPITSLYLSIQTFTTLGYGDFNPNSINSKILVIGELITVLIIVFVKLPVAISVLKVEIEQKKK